MITRRFFTARLAVTFTHRRRFRPISSRRYTAATCRVANDRFRRHVENIVRPKRNPPKRYEWPPKHFRHYLGGRCITNARFGHVKLIAFFVRTTSTAGDTAETGSFSVHLYARRVFVLTRAERNIRVMFPSFSRKYRDGLIVSGKRLRHTVAVPIYN